MKRFVLLALVPFLFATTNEDRPGLPPGVPENCCGYGNCRRASVEIISRGPGGDVVAVDGVRLELPPGTAQRSKKDSSWWCYQEVFDGCEKEISRRCARCAVAGGKSVGEMRVIPAVGHISASHFLLPVLPAGGCAECHASGVPPVRPNLLKSPRGAGAAPLPPG